MKYLLSLLALAFAFQVHAADPQVILLKLDDVIARKIGTSDNPRGLKIRYRLVEGALVKKSAQAAPSVAPKPAAIADPLPAIDLKVAQQQLEKTLTDLQETQAALASELTEKRKTHPAVMKLEAMHALESWSSGPMTNSSKET